MSRSPNGFARPNSLADALTASGYELTGYSGLRQNKFAAHLNETARNLGFVPLPDPIRESEVHLTLQWSADERTG